MTKAELEAGLAAVAAGDPNALAELYRAYYQPVFLLAASLTGIRRWRRIRCRKCS